MKSGHLTLRMPKNLHQKVSDAAIKEGVSMNQYIIAVLAGATEYGSRKSEPKKNAKRSQR